MAKMYFAGLPTEIDLDKLREAYGVPKEGDVISYDEISKLIGVGVRSHRFVTVTTAWRRNLVREHNVYMKAHDGKFEVMNPSARVNLGSQKLRTGARCFRKANIIVTSTDTGRLTAEQKEQARHIQMITSAAIQSARLKDRSERPELPSAVGQ